MELNKKNLYFFIQHLILFNKVSKNRTDRCYALLCSFLSYGIIKMKRKIVPTWLTET